MTDTTVGNVYDGEILSLREQSLLRHFASRVDSYSRWKADHDFALAKSQSGDPVWTEKLAALNMPGAMPEIPSFPYELEALGWKNPILDDNGNFTLKNVLNYRTQLDPVTGEPTNGSYGSIRMENWLDPQIDLRIVLGTDGEGQSVVQGPDGQVNLDILGDLGGPLHDSLYHKAGEIFLAQQAKDAYEWLSTNPNKTKIVLNTSLGSSGNAIEYNIALALHTPNFAIYSLNGSNLTPQAAENINLMMLNPNSAFRNIVGSAFQMGAIQLNATGTRIVLGSNVHYITWDGEVVGSRVLPPEGVDSKWVRPPVSLAEYIQFKLSQHNLAQIAAEGLLEIIDKATNEYYVLEHVDETTAGAHGSNVYGYLVGSDNPLYLTDDTQVYDQPQAFPNTTSNLASVTAANVQDKLDAIQVAASIYQAASNPDSGAMQAFKATLFGKLFQPLVASTARNAVEMVQGILANASRLVEQNAGPLHVETEVSGVVLNVPQSGAVTVTITTLDMKSAVEFTKDLKDFNIDSYTIQSGTGGSVTKDGSNEQINGYKDFQHLEQDTGIPATVLPSYFPPLVQFQESLSSNSSYWIDVDRVVGDFNQILSNWAIDNGVLQNSTLSSYTLTANTHIDVNAVYAKGTDPASYFADLYGISQQSVLSSNPFLLDQVNAQSGYWWAAPTQLTMPGSILSNNSFTNGLMSSYLTNIGLSTAQLVLPSLALAPITNNFVLMNMQSPALSLTYSGLSFVQNYFNPIGAFYEGGTLSYDESLAISDKIGRLLQGSNAVDKNQFDALDTNSDGVISSQDTGYANLNVWQDMNENGVLDLGELKTLTQAGLASIPLRDKDIYTSGNAKNVAPQNVATIRDSLALTAPTNSFSSPSAPTDAAPTIDYNYYRNTIDPVHTYGHVWTSNEIKITNDSQYLVGTASGDSFGNSYYSTSGYSDVPNMLGGDGDDTMVAFSGANSIWGGNGNDGMLAGTGNDRLMGEAGNDTAFGQLGNDSLWGGDGTDYLAGFYQGSETVHDLASGQTDNDLIFGGAGNDTLIGQVGNDTLSGDDGNDTVYGFSFSDDTKTSLNAYETDNDQLFGGAGLDTLVGGVGNDTLSGGDGNDALLGFASTTDAKYALTGSETDNDLIFGGAGNDSAYGQIGNDTISGDDGDDLLVGFYQGADSVHTLGSGQTDNDLIFGGAGNDTLVGQVGNDTLSGGDGNDVIKGAGFNDDPKTSLNAYETDNDALFGGAGLDTLVGGVGNDTMDGGDGNDLLIGFYTTDPGGDVFHELSGSETDNDVMFGGAGNDTLIGQVGNDSLFGDDGDDVITGFTSTDDDKVTLSTGETDNDLIDGGAGNDTLQGNTGDDALYGGSGDDLIFGYRSPNEADYSLPAGETDNDSLWGGDGADQLQGQQGNDWLSGDSGNDSIFGQVGNDTLYGGDGNDILQGFTGSNETKQTLDTGETDNDFLYGGAGNDTLLGSVGDDYLDGGAGADSMEGGAGNDTFIVNTINDVILERPNAGTDSIFSSVSYLLNANVENLHLLGSDDINGSGNKLDNAVYGNAGNNILDGVTGADTMVGYAGNDVYYVDNVNDSIIEKANDGHDSVQSSISWTLGDNQEDMTLLSYNIPEKGRIDGQDALIFGYPKRYELDYAQGDADPDYRGTCALTTISNLIIQAGGNTSEADVVSYAVANDLCITTADTGSTALTRGGSTMVEQIQLLQHFGYQTAATIWGSGGVDLEVVAEKILQGHGVLLAVNGGILWDAPGSVGTGDVNHDITVSGVVYNLDKTEILGFYICDSGRGMVSDMTRYISYADLHEAADVPSGYIISTLDTDKVWDVNLDATGNALDNKIVGTDGNNILSGLSGADTLIGGAGNDTYIVDNVNDLVFENLGGGTDIVNAAVSYTLSANIENLTLTGSSNINATGNSSANTIIGNSGSNTLTGGAGDDTLYGGGGTDTFVGGLGNDTFVINATTDVITESVGEGIDTVQFGNTYSLAAIANVENVVLTGSSAVNATGNALNNTLTGNSANNVLDGGAGADTLIGGSGNDTYIADNTDDVVTEGANAGTDLVQASATYTLSANVENLTLTGSDNINATGNTLDNVLTGNSGNNILSGGGGTDTLIGGTGDDTYVIDELIDVVTENANEGVDTIQTGITYSLGSVSNIENLTLTGTNAINATGDALNNVLAGNSADNILDGGAGADTLQGGSGNDIYIVENAGDVVTEGTNAGIDVVQSSISYSLTSNVENLTLTGTADVDATGNALANVLTGNAGNNVLDGAAGADTLVGGSGNDTYIVDDASDVVTEGSSAGTDVVQSSVTYALSANVENLTLTGSGNINATGNSLDNALTGNSGNNVFDGGTGTDTFVGGSGNDTYVIDDAADSITENASEGTDTVQSSISYTLGSNLENLTLTGNSAIDGTGNGLNNVITGNSASNILSGGTGTDSLIGGAGDDTYVVDDLNDVVTENSSEGIDTVQTGISYSLASTANVENLTLTGTDNVDATGNALANVLTGNSGNNVLDGGAGADTLVGGSGNDTYVVDDAGDVVTEGASAGTDVVQSSISYTLGAHVENLTLTGSGNINATGNSLDNVLTGNSGNNVFDGGTGTDTFVGGSGNDTYVINDATDIVTESASEGTDTVQSSISYALGSNLENLTLTGNAAIDGTGNSLNNVITGNSASNTLSGGAGTDTLVGGAGDDTYVVDDLNDVVTENSSEGTDTIQTGISYSLSAIANVENLSLIGTADVDATGNALANVLTGNAGSNVLDGGVGADTLMGDSGNDTYVVDDAGDVVTESASAGTDVVQSSVTYALSANVENLTLTGSGNINATGNSLDNVLTGNAGNNVLDGGAGTDSFVGGAGNDTYVINDATDSITENASEGTDTVQSSISYTLGSSLENLTLTGNTAIYGTGNSLNNVITGNSASNILNGGTGTDTLVGGAGDDTYVVNDLNDVVTENSSEGTDTIQTAISYSLSPIANVENLTLTGTGDVDATGNALANVLTGNSGNNVLDGGAGADTLVGGSGNDTYVVDDAGDVVTEGASAGTDVVQSSISYTLGANVENLTLTGSGDINATGNSLDNVLTGNSGNNVFDGGTGTDTFVGGSGNDTYVIDDAADSITENASEGTDTVQSSISYTLGSNLENLTLTGNSAIDGTGNSLNNLITGNSASNILSGGAGTDTLSGGAGDDTYVVNDLNDVVTENSSEGTDTVQSSVSYALGSNVENLTLTGTADIDATGNALDNVLTGNSGINVLSGGAGNDTYVIDDATDSIIENSNEGIDTVQSSISYTLGSNLEDLTLTGNTAIDGTGNSLNNVIAGNSANNILNGGTGADTLVGGAGDDTYVVNDLNDVVTENSSEGTDTIQTGISYSLSSTANVENLTLTGAADVDATGNSLDNILTSNSGNNILDGGTGADTLVGGGGNDTYVVDDAGDVVTEGSSAGTDVIQSSISYTLGTNVENLTLTGSGNINATGNSLDNVLTGNSGNNVLDGGTGTDTFVGGSGNDTYVINDATDIVTESASEGTDTVQSSVSYTLSDNVENLTLTGTTDIDATGNALDNILTGNSSINILDGGAGTDTLIGGAGDDTYVVDDLNDVVTENSSEGTDTVQSSVSYTLSDNVENLTLTGTADIDATGNELDNVLTGNFGINVFSGGAGNDTYVIEDETDSITENASEGIDTVQSSISYTLGSNLENLTLTGEGAISGTGNILDNVITGNSLSNALSGDTGTDTLIGGDGGDIYTVDDLNDVVIENANEGFDTIQAGISYSIASVANVEYLTLTGSADIDGIGNAMDNILVGNSGNNILDGGAGADIMVGDFGDDTYVVDDAGDIVAEDAFAGTDLVQSSVSYTLGSGVENLTLTGDSAIDGTGNSLNNVVTGNSANNILSGDAGVDSLIGGAGDDTYIIDDHYDVVSENVSEGIDTVQSSVSYTLRSNLENLTLTGTDDIYAVGNELDNVLAGNSGINILAGQAGNDTYVINDAADSIVENANEGIDTVQSSISYTLGSNVENLILTGLDNIDATGNALDNIFTGNAGFNVFAGGAGNDTYFINAGDSVTEYANQGIDTVQSDFSYVLESNLENLTLTGTADINAFGNELANMIIGNSGNNILSGGEGNDTLVGGAGDDTYVVVDLNDVVTETAGEGIDTVQAYISYTLGSHLENLTLGGEDDIDATGNALDNVLTGNFGINVLSGGTGNDTYVIEDAADSIIENANEGIDTVQSSITYTLGSHLENLTLIGTDDIDATGNALDNVLTGNSGINVLSGGAGNDTYVIDDAADSIVENTSEGIDTVQSSVSYTLESNLENLTLTGTADIDATGNELDNVLTGNSGINVLSGGSGNDTYVIDDAVDSIVENSSEGIDTVQSSISYMLGSNLEDLTLTGVADIDATGNALDNVLMGNSGANVLDGGAGADTLIGGAGNDTYIVDDLNDVVTENTSEGTDIVQSSVSYTLGSNLENLTLTGTADVDATGNALDNVLTGNSGINVLAGGAGNDTYLIDDAADSIVENSSEGIDTVQSSISYTLGSNLENLTLTGTGDLDATGNALDNVITGNSGVNILSGGAGDDTYVIDDAADSIVENTSAGTDTVQSSISYTIGSNLEDLTLTGTADIDATGNELDNVITGNSGVNILDGGAGADTLIGGAGNDTYIVDDLNDVVTENSGEGTDTVQSSVSYALGSNVENLTLTGTGDLDATGNALDNVITGNSGVNILSGGAGDDTYVIDDAADSIVENTSEGIDTVQSSISYTLGSNLENLTLTGSADIDATGNELDNVLTGNSGSNVLAGGAGNDTYVIDAADSIVENSSEGIDTVQSSVSYVLGSNLENLTLTGTADIDATGNALDNVLTGNSGINILSAGVGNDTYVIEDAADSIIENASEGIDTVQASVSYTLGSNLENLTLTGTDDVDATGNELDNILTGNSGVNFLDGGTGTDILVGGAGDDTYVVDDLNDVVTEEANDGIDSIQAGISYSIASVANVENLTLTGTDNIDGTGNDLDNVLTGNDGNNVLDGGAGSDTLMGSLGTDTFIMGSGATHLTIDEYQTTEAGADILQLDFASTDISLVSSNAFGPGDLTIAGTDGRTVTIKNEFVDGYKHVNAFQFSDDVDLSLSELMQNGLTYTLVGDGVSTDQSAATYSLTINADGDGDSISGGTGATIINASGDEVEIWMNGTGTVNATGTGNLIHIETGSDVTVNAGDDATIYDGAGHNTITGSGVIYALNGDDTITFTGDTEVYSGRFNSNTYIFGHGSGNNVVHFSSESSNDTAMDEIHFLPGVDPTDLVFSQSGNNIVLSLPDSGDQITLAGFSFSGSPGHPKTIDRFVFDDGRVFDLSSLIWATYTYSNSDDNAEIDLRDYTKSVIMLTSTGDNAHIIGSDVDGMYNIYTYGDNDDIELGAGGGAFNVDGDYGTVTGGSGNGWVSFSGDYGTFVGASGTDYVSVTGNDAVITAGSGMTSITVSGTDNIVNGGNGMVEIYDYGTNTIINAGSGMEAIHLTATGASFTGATGEDYIWADGNDSVITAGSGSTMIMTSGENAELNAGSGTSMLMASGSYSVINGSTGDATLVTLGSNSTINGGSGNEMIALFGDDNHFIGTSGTDFIYALGANAVIDAGSGATSILALGAGATITTGSGSASVATFGGNATVVTGSGDVTYHFEDGFGANSIANEDGGTDSIIFGSSIGHDAVAFFRQDYDLLVSYANSSDLITIENEFAAGSDYVGTLQLDDGTFLTQSDINLVIQSMSNYATNNSIAFTGIDDVKNSTDLMNIVAGSWRTT